MHRRLVSVFTGRKAISTPLRYAVSLRHLASLPIDPKVNFNAVCEYVKSVTKDDVGYRSYAMHLYKDPRQKHLVCKRPQVFVSYAWSGLFGPSMAALIRNIPAGQDDIFVWMDVALVDQHAAANTNIDFERWTETFGETLRWIGKAFLLLLPGKRPIAVTRSWCCFEIYCIKAAGIEYIPCMALEDEQELMDEMRTGHVAFALFNTLFAGINVEAATAFKDSDRLAILEMMRKFGIVAVNDVVLLVVKKWLVGVAEQAEKREVTGTQAMSAVLSARGSLHQALGEVDLALPFFERSLQNGRTVPDNDKNVSAQLNNLAMLLQTKGAYDQAEPLYRESLAIKRRLFGDDDIDAAAALNNLAALLEDKGDYLGAEALYKEALAIDYKMYGDEHPVVAADLNNLAALWYGIGDYAAAEPLYRASLVMRKQILGDWHPDVAQSLNNLAALLTKQGNITEAKVLFEEALAIRQRVLGNSHPNVAQTLEWLANIHLEQGDHAEAMRLGREGLVIHERALGSAHPQTVRMQEKWG